MSFLEIVHLSKIYPKSEYLPPALNDISLKIENRGLIFVTGKSGSGKSTFLNLIGGLDSITKGDIVLKGRKYSTYKEKDFNNLRKNEIGFVFQDFSLIDNLSVFENIKLAATIKDEIVDKDKINSAIEEVGLKGYENHLSKNLSAGQRQRVAIARAIIKAPEILLCDEPTGNLDFITSHEILQIIKKISERSLVILVSHNLEDAYSFADRIIELEGGVLKADMVLKNKDLIIGDTVYISGIDFLSKNNLDSINQGIKKGSVKNIKSRKDLFVPYQEKNEPFEQKSYANRHISFKKSFELMNKLLKRQFFKIGLFAFVGAILSSLFAVCYMFVNYTPEIVYSQVAKQANYVSDIFRKMTQDTYYPYGVELFNDRDFKKINATVPSEEYSKLVNIHPFYSDSCSFENNNYPVYDGSTISSFFSVLDRSLYAKESVGVLVTDEAFVKQRYNLEEITYLAKAEEIKPEGTYLTDFVIDQYIQRKGLSITYSDYVGQLTTSVSNIHTVNRNYINGIIKTDYKEKFKVVIDELDRLRETYPGGLKSYQETDEFHQYLFDIYSNYLCGYSFNETYLNDFVNSPIHSYVKAVNAIYTITYNEEEVSIHDYRNNAIGNPGVTSKFYNFKGEETDYSSQTIYFPANILNSIFVTALTPNQWTEALGENAKINVNIYNPLTNKAIFQKSYKLVVSGTNNLFMSSQDVINEVSKVVIGYSDIIFTNTKNVRHVFSKIAAKGYISYNISPSFPKHISTGVEMYVNLFKILLSFSLIALLAVVAFVSYNNVRRFTYEIGVTKSLGASLGDVFKIFSLQELYLLIATSVMAIVGTYIATYLSNYVLKSTFNAGRISIYDINILIVDYKVLLVVVAIIIATSVLAMIIPFINMKKLKPINILKSKY